MEKNGSRVASDPMRILLLILSSTTGLVDAVSVLGLGKVFTANMTGNIVFMAFAAARAPGFYFPPYMVALLIFMAGAYLAGMVGKSSHNLPLKSWLVRAAWVEFILLTLAAVIAVGFDIKTQHPRWILYAIIALTACAMGFRNATVRQLKVPDLTTTVLTLTITGIAADSTLAGNGKSNLGVRVGAVAAIFFGAAIGAVLVLNLGLAVPLFITALTILLTTYLLARHPNMERPHA